MLPLPEIITSDKGNLCGYGSEKGRQIISLQSTGEKRRHIRITG